MGFEFNNDTPIYLQLIEYIKMQIISKKYLPNQKLPSVRELSFEFEVNPNTIQKALGELENIGLIYTERTNGKFVTANEELIKQVTETTLKSMVNKFFSSMTEMGLSKKEILEIINKVAEED